MYRFIGRLTATYPWLICAAWLVAGAVLATIAPTWNSRSHDDDIRFLPARCDSVRGYHMLEQSFPRDIFASRVIFAVERADEPLTKEDHALVDAFVGDLNRLKREEPDLQIGNISSCRDGLIGNRLSSADRKCTLIQVSLGTPFLALQTRETVDRADELLQKRLGETKGRGPRVMATGPAGIGRDLIRASAESLEGTTLATIVLVVVVLLLVYRAPLLALVPLITIAISVWVSLSLLALMTKIPGVHLVNISKIFAIVILYGSGTDYCLFLISRYQEELGHGHDVPGALGRSIGQVGSALTASAGTVICGLGLMGFAEFAKIRCAGPAIALSLAVALVASLTLAPALLRLLGRAVFWPSRGPNPAMRLQSHGLHGNTRVKEPLWEWISRGVVARPVLVWSAAVLALAPLAIAGLRVTPNYKPTGELSPSSPSVQGVEAIQRHFTAGEIGPLTVLLQSSEDWNSPRGRELIAHLSRGFAFLPNVAEVRSLTQPLGAPMKLPTPAPVGDGGLLGGFFKSFRKDIDKVLEKAALAAREFYVAQVPGDKGTNYVTRLDVILRTDPFDAASMATQEQLQTWVNEVLPETGPHMPDLKAECYGVTVSARDLANVTEADRKRINLLVLAGIFLILLVLVRKPWLAAYLLLTVLFSYFATLGATATLVHLWTGRPFGQVEWRVPFFLFTILVAVGEDYNIFLITRMLQETKRHGVVEGTRRALAFTGGTITSCGLIMAGTFATLMLSGLGTLMQIGFALAFGVLIDTFVVRPILVPALTLIVWRLQAQEEDDRGETNRKHAIPMPRRLPRAG